MNIKQKIREYFSNTLAKPIGDNDDVFALGLVDSLFALQLVLFVEKAFHLQVEGDELDLDNFSTIDAIATFVETKSGRVIS